ncbi:hypothetical protein [Isoptericola sp. NPDC057559]|uniref:hypothetical protein n=1 Tax=Isoptericola sp. NPDC057559 TaxID=3346168 RepID=UPI0036AF8157
MADLAPPAPAASPTTDPRATRRDVVGLVVTGLVTLVAMPFVAFFYLVAAFGGHDGIAGLIVVPIVVAGLVGTWMMWRRGAGGRVLGAAGPVGALLACCVYFSTNIDGPALELPELAVATGLLAAGIAAFALPGRAARSGVALLALTVVVVAAGLLTAA